jgi:uncharacterized protein YukE
MAPGPDQITVALGALRKDASQWDHAADVLRAVAGRARDEASLPPAAFSFAGQAVATAYDALRTKMAGLLEAGSRNVDDIATALRRSADAYEADEIAGAHRMNSTY